MTDVADAESPPCWLHPDTPVVDCPTCPEPPQVCVAHGPYFGGVLSCPRCLVDMQRHRTRARNALVGMLRDIKKEKQRAPTLVRCAAARAEQMREIVKALGLEITVEPVDDFQWDKLQLLRR